MPVAEKSGLKQIKEMIQENDFKEENRGELKSKTILKDYIEHIFDFADFKKIKPFKIIIDTANGAAGLIVPEIFLKISGNLIQLFADFDGSFPNHDPNPSESENTKDLQEKVLSEKADLGAAFDGDGDRILFINEKGKRINPDLIAALIIHHYFKHAGKILYTNITSWTVRDEIKDSKNEAVCSKVGHSFIKEKMRKEKVIFGCEPSGHYYFKENYFIESPFIVLLMVLEIMSKTQMPLSELIKPFKGYYREEINIKKSSFTGRFPKEETKEFSDWWYNIRASNTEPVIRLTIEVKSKELLEQKKKQLLKSISFFS